MRGRFFDKTNPDHVFLDLSLAVKKAEELAAPVSTGEGSGKAMWTGVSLTNMYAREGLKADTAMV